MTEKSQVLLNSKFSFNFFFNLKLQTWKCSILLKIILCCARKSKDPTNSTSISAKAGGTGLPDRLCSHFHPRTTHCSHQCSGELGKCFKWMKKTYSASNKLLISFQPVHFVLKTTLNELCFLSLHLGLQESLFSLCLVEMSIISSRTVCLYLSLWIYTALPCYRT